MDEIEQPRRGPGRPPRAEVEKTQRRRRGEGSLGVQKRLYIPPAVAARLKAEGKSARWANDEGNRMHQLTELDDYDKVEGVAPVLVGTAPDGTPIKAHLLAKPVDFINEDKAKAENRRRETETALVRGQVPGAGPNQRPSENGPTYADAANTIGRGNTVLE